MTQRRGNLRLDRVSQRYGKLTALNHISLDVSPGQFVTLLGPSGSGKTTTLRIIAGFSQPDEGRVLLDGKDLTDVPAYRREIGMVFQHYALFPHMTLADNIGFPLKMRNEPRGQIRSKVERALDMVRMRGLGQRWPSELSGGQQQRIAVARALVFRPPVLLMDEPLGALDRKLREEMQLEIVRIGRDEGITIIYVTHDQEEALAMSDRIAVYQSGRIEQIGSPKEIYERPVNHFVGRFVGESTSLHGKLTVRDGRHYLQGAYFCIPVDSSQCRQEHLRNVGAAVLLVRPEALHIAPQTSVPAMPPSECAELRGFLRSSAYLGHVRRYVVEMPDRTVAVVRSKAGASGTLALVVGCEVRIWWRVDSATVLPEDGSALKIFNASAETDT